MYQGQGHFVYDLVSNHMNPKPGQYAVYGGSFQNGLLSEGGDLLYLDSEDLQSAFNVSSVPDP